MVMRTVSIYDGKYTFTYDEDTMRLHRVTRNDEEWLVMLEDFQFSKVKMGLLTRIIELELKLAAHDAEAKWASNVHFTAHNEVQRATLAQTNINDDGA